MTGLDADKLTAMLADCRLARQIVVLDQTSSTNDVVAAAALEGAEEGMAVFAGTQTAGRGRLGRKWHSGAHHGLWFSVLLRPKISQRLWMRLTTWVAVAVASAIERTVSCRVMIKWPNDLQIAGKKIAGILIESGVDKARAPFAVLGVGVNVNQEASDFPAEIESIAGSLWQATKQRVDFTTLAAAILRELDQSQACLNSDFAETVASAAARSSLLGQRLQLRAGTELVEGTALRLDENGALILAKTGGGEFVAVSGEVTIISSATH